MRPDNPLQVRNRFRSGAGDAGFQCDSESEGYPQGYKLIGRTAKIADLADVMITSSSNLATNLLLDFLTKSSRDAVVGILLKQKFNSMIPALLPPHASVAHKTGEISSACHDAGIVYLPERQPYLVAILTETNLGTEKRRECVSAISEAVSQCVTGQPIEP